MLQMGRLARFRLRRQWRRRWLAGRESSELEDWRTSARMIGVLANGCDGHPDARCGAVSFPQTARVGGPPPEAVLRARCGGAGYGTAAPPIMGASRGCRHQSGPVLCSSAPAGVLCRRDRLAVSHGAGERKCCTDEAAFASRAERRRCSSRSLRASRGCEDLFREPPDAAPRWADRGFAEGDLDGQLDSSEPTGEE